MNADARLATAISLGSPVAGTEAQAAELRPMRGFACIMNSPGVVTIMDREGKTVNVDFTRAGGAYVLEAILAQTFVSGQLDGIREARAIMKGGAA